jgi:hypothetical protein
MDVLKMFAKETWEASNSQWNRMGNDIGMNFERVAFLVDEEFLSEKEIYAIKVEELKCKLFNEYIDLCEEDDKTVEGLDDKKFDRYMRLYEYFRNIPMKKKKEWIDIGVQIKYPITKY